MKPTNWQQINNLRSAHTMGLVPATSRRDLSHRVNWQLVPATSRSRIVCADLKKYHDKSKNQKRPIFDTHYYH